MDSTLFNQRFFSFLKESTSAFHAIEAIRKRLDANGFIYLHENERWSINTCQPYYIVRDDASLIAFNRGKDDTSGIRMVGAHSDSPSLKIKPQPDIFDKSYHKLGVEVYGGAILGSWFDRPLSIAGRVAYIDKNGRLYRILIDLKKAAAILPSVALHLDREVNNGKSVNAQKDIIPLIGAGNQQKSPPFAKSLIDVIKQQHGSVEIEDIIGFDLFFYDPQPPGYAGLNDEFVVSSRLDNLLSCFVAVEALTAAGNDHNYIFVCNNHEEVGSTTAPGAQGNMLLALMERIYPDNDNRHSLLADSFFISMDNAHAVHPNHPQKHDDNHSIYLNYGPVIKTNALQRYASTGISAAVFRLLCKEAGVKTQDFVMRNDLACGSTIGPLTSAKLGLSTVDVGAASLAMHSLQETTGSEDPLLLYKVIHHFLTCQKMVKIL
ncbi:MAG TPA: M18 family aminopeptidase [Desulfopila sp.]|nr:M18 family aminopeptidase [Desulfopila sp.]